MAGSKGSLSTIALGLGAGLIGWWMAATPAPPLLVEANPQAALLSTPAGIVLLLIGGALVGLVVQTELRQ